jgi:hypothetical protein
VSGARSACATSSRSSGSIDPEQLRRGEVRPDDLTASVDRHQARWREVVQGGRTRRARVQLVAGAEQLVQLEAELDAMDGEVVGQTGDR